MFIRFISIVIVYASSGKAINEPQSLSVSDLLTRGDRL